MIEARVRLLVLLDLQTQCTMQLCSAASKICMMLALRCMLSDITQCSQGMLDITCTAQWKQLCSMMSVHHFNMCFKESCWIPFQSKLFYVYISDIATCFKAQHHFLTRSLYVALRSISWCSRWRVLSIVSPILVCLFCDLYWPVCSNSPLVHMLSGTWPCDTVWIEWGWYTHCVAALFCVAPVSSNWVNLSYSLIGYL